MNRRRSKGSLKGMRSGVTRAQAKLKTECSPARYSKSILMMDPHPHLNGAWGGVSDLEYVRKKGYVLIQDHSSEMYAAAFCYWWEYIGKAKQSFIVTDAWRWYSDLSRKKRIDVTGFNHAFNRFSAIGFLSRDWGRHEDAGNHIHYAIPKFVRECGGFKWFFSPENTHDVGGTLESKSGRMFPELKCSVVALVIRLLKKGGYDINGS